MKTIDQFKKLESETKELRTMLSVLLSEYFSLAKTRSDDCDTCPFLVDEDASNTPGGILKFFKPSWWKMQIENLTDSF